MQETAIDEKQPYKEKYDARGLLEICLALCKLPDLTSQLTRALCYHKLGLIAYDTDEITPAQTHMLESLRLWQSMPPTVQFDHVCTIQDVNNQLAIIYSAREDYAKAIEYLKEAEKAYSFFDKGDPLPTEIEQWQRGIRSALEQNLTQTYFYFA